MLYKYTCVNCLTENSFEVGKHISLQKFPNCVKCSKISGKLKTCNSHRINHYLYPCVRDDEKCILCLNSSVEELKYDEVQQSRNKINSDFNKTIEESPNSLEQGYIVKDQYEIINVIYNPSECMNSQGGLLYHYGYSELTIERSVNFIRFIKIILKKNNVNIVIPVIEQDDGEFLYPSIAKPDDNMFEIGKTWTISPKLTSIDPFNGKIYVIPYIKSKIYPTNGINILYDDHGFYDIALDDSLINNDMISSDVYLE